MTKSKPRFHGIARALPLRVVVRPRPRYELLAADPDHRERLLVVAAAVVQVLSSQPGISLRKLRAAVRAVRGRCSDGDTDAAVELLGAAVRFEDGPRCGWKLSLDMSNAPAEVVAALTAQMEET